MDKKNKQILKENTMAQILKPKDCHTPRPLADSFGTAAYGGEGWSPLSLTHEQELGTLWTCGFTPEKGGVRCAIWRI